MAEIILAFIAGVLFGGCCVYLRFRKVTRDNLRTLEKLKLDGARLEGAIDTLIESLGIDVEDEANEDSKWPKQNINRFNKTSYADDNHNSSGLLDED